jgi:hypothetical protein
MALVSHHFEVVAQFTESSGKSVSRTYVAADDVTDFAALAVNWAIALPIVNGATDSVLSSYSYKQVFVEDALVLPADAENNDQAFMTAKIVGDPLDSGTLSVPAAAIGMFVAASGKGRDVVNTAVGSLAYNYAQLFGAPGLNWTLSDGENIDLATLGGTRRNTSSSNS